jgi:chemotaxis protein methyltransferase CheR
MALNNARLDPASFRKIAEIAYRESGLTLVEEKTSMIQSRLRHRLRELGIGTFADYCGFVASDAGGAERRMLISALTTNVSHFFRERHHFEELARIVGERLARLRAGASLRLWSAGCSNGQEALSAAMCLLELAPELADLDLRILATDIDPEVLRFATAARYPARMTAGIPPDLLKRYFDIDGEDAGEPVYAARPVLTRLIRYRELNLLSDWPMRGRFDVIFCRNVVIYFDAATQAALWPRFRAALPDDGTLFLGHSERIATPEAPGFACTGSTTYRPLGAAPPARRNGTARR